MNILNENKVKETQMYIKEKEKQDKINLIKQKCKNSSGQNLSKVISFVNSLNNQYNQ